MNTIKSVLLIFIISFTYSCNKVESPLESQIFEFPVEKTIEGIPLSENIIASVSDFIITESYLVLKTTDTEDQITIFEWPSMDSLYAFGKKGKGPDEYNVPILASCDNGNDDFCIVDLGGNKMKCFYIEPSHPYLYTSNEQEWNTNDLPPYITISNNAIYYLSFFPREGHIVKVPFEKGSDSEIIYDFREYSNDYPLSDVYNASFDIYNNKIIIAYDFFPIFEIIDLEDNFIMHKFEYKDLSHPPKLILRENGGIESIRSKRYYHDSEVTKENIFLLYFGFSEEEAMSNIDDLHTEIHIYDWQGNPIEKLITNNLLDNIAIDRKRRIILGHDIRSVDPLYIFDY